MALPLAIPLAVAGANLLGGLFGSKKVKQVDSTPSDIKGLRGQLGGYLGSNMSGLQQTAATSTHQPVERTGDVQGPTWQPLQQANQGTYNTSGVYGGLQGWRPNTQTQAVGFNGIGSAGTGNTGAMIAQLGRQQNWNGAAGPDVRAASVGAQQIGPNTQTQSVADLGQGFAGQFMQNYNPLFEQQRQQALAAAKEASGNLTGSGFANALGTATAQTLAQQQGRLADLAQFGIGQEMARQQAGAGLDFQRNAANAGNDLQAQMANQSAGLTAGLQNRNTNLDALLRGGALNQSGLQAALAGENMNLGREQDRLSNEAQLGAQIGLQNRGMTSQELQNASDLDLRRLLGLAGMQQGDAQFGANLEQQNNQFNAGQFNNRGDLMAQMQQQLGLQNRGMNSQEAQFWAQLGQNNQQFNAGQMNDMGNANANRLASLLGGLSTAGVGAPQTYQQKNFFDSLAGGVNAALPFLPGNKGGAGGGTRTLLDITGGRTPGLSASVPGYTGGYYNTPSTSMGPRVAGMGGLEMAPSPQSQMAGLLASLRNPGSGMGTQGGYRPASTYLNDLPFMRVG